MAKRNSFGCGVVALALACCVGCHAPKGVPVPAKGVPVPAKSVPATTKASTFPARRADGRYVVLDKDGWWEGWVTPAEAKGKYPHLKVWKNKASGEVEAYADTTGEYASDLFEYAPGD